MPLRVAGVRLPSLASSSLEAFLSLRLRYGVSSSVPCLGVSILRRQNSSNNTSTETFAKLKTPLLPLKLLKIKGFVPMIGVGVVGQMGFYGFNIFAPQIAQRLYTTKNIEIGLIAVSSQLLF